MNKIFFIIGMGCLSLAATTKLETKATNKPVKIENMKIEKQSKEIVQGFFNAFGKGDLNGILHCFHDSCTIIGIRDAKRKEKQIYGTYHGTSGVKDFIANLGNSFDTKAFSVNSLISEGNIVFANGKFTHIVKSTGKTFSSDWALMCVIKEDKIFEYHFYEDSEMFSIANK